MEIRESKAVSCSDPRCVMSFDSIQDLQCHCQDVHCIERINLDPIKRCCRTHLSSLNVKASPGAVVKLEYHCDLLGQEISLKRVNEPVDSQKLEMIETIVPTGLVGLAERSSLSRGCSLPSIDSIMNQDKQSSSRATFTNSETPLSINGRTADRAILDNLTPASSISSDLSLSIDPRLLDESD